MNIVSCQSIAELGASFSTKILHFNYEEFDDNNVKLNQEKGVIPGIGLTFVNKRKRFKQSVEIESYLGEVDYNGFLQSGKSHKTNTQQFLVNMAYQIAWSPLAQSRHEIFAEYAFHNWQRDILATSNAIGLFEEYSWFSLEIGARFEILQRKSHQLDSTFSVFRNHLGKIEIDQSDDGFKNPTLNLGDRFGFSGGLVYQYRIQEHGLLQLSAQFSYWQFGKSNTEKISNGQSIRTIHEPKSTSKQALVGITYKTYF